MLKYRLCKDNFLNKNNQVVVLSSEKRILLGENGDNRLLLVCECEDVTDFTEGMSLYARNVVSVSYNSYALISNDYIFTDTLYITGVNTEESTISMYIDKYVDLNLSTVSLQYIEEYDVDNNGGQVINYVLYAYFNFEETHYLTDPSVLPTVDLSIIISYGQSENDRDVIPSKYVEWINKNCLRIKGEYLKTRFPDSFYAMFGGLDEPTISEGILGYTYSVSILRNTFLYDYDEDNNIFNYELYFDRPIQIYKIPFSQQFSTNLFKEYGIKDRFLDVERVKAINGIVDTEKNVYYPVIKNGDSYLNVYKIIFNLHFREHRGDDWSVNEDDSWNGTYTSQRGSYPSIELMNPSDNTQYGYFSYKCDSIGNNILKDESYQSDLLTYLGFSNDDVRYQKNRLKKSFLRLSFYDSENPANQNLLGYSTVFFDTRKLFSRYSTHFEDKPYSMLDYENIDTNITTKFNLTGIRVNREPYDTTLSSILNHEDYIENGRLSTQLVIQDKYNSSYSSEGFYLYIWRSNSSPLPQDIYMKAEFNHAGYGRTIPLIMPYFEDGETSYTTGGKIKTFEEIVEDWNMANPNGSKKSEDVGYTVRRYLRYNYIHFKYLYDISSKQFIYYLDDELYGTKNLSTAALDNTLIFNLYEGNIGTQNADDGNITSYCYDYNEMIVTLSYGTMPSKGGKVSPTLSFSVPLLNSSGEYVKLATQDNTSYVADYTMTILNERTDVEIDNYGRVSAEETQTTDLQSICSVQVTVTVGTGSAIGCDKATGTVLYTIQQLGKADDKYTYSNMKFTVTYPSISGCSMVSTPTIYYEYDKTDSDGECIHIKYTSDTDDEGNQVTEALMCSCEEQYDDDPNWVPAGDNDSASMSFTTTETSPRFTLDETTGIVTALDVNEDDVSKTLGTVTAQLICGNNTTTTFATITQEYNSDVEKEYDCNNATMQFEYENAVEAEGGRITPSFTYSIPWGWSGCEGGVEYTNALTDVSSYLIETKYSFEPISGIENVTCDENDGTLTVKRSATTETGDLVELGVVTLTLSFDEEEIGCPPLTATQTVYQYTRTSSGEGTYRYYTGNYYKVTDSLTDTPNTQETYLSDSVWAYIPNEDEYINGFRVVQYVDGIQTNTRYCKSQSWDDPLDDGVWHLKYINSYIGTREGIPQWECHECWRLEDGFQTRFFAYDIFDFDGKFDESQEVNWPDESKIRND